MPFRSFLGEARALVDDSLEALLPSADTPPARLHQAMRYSVMVGGKRFRPAVTLLVGTGLGASRGAVLPGAAAMEMIHTFSLIHDDLPALDDDDLRRGRPTCHRQFDEATAVLAGDALLNLGLSTLATMPASATREIRCAAVALVTEAVGTMGMIGGQMNDLEAERAWPEDPAAALERIHRLKTGALLTGSVRLGGLYAGADDGLDRDLTRFGEGIGMLFQISDDILDVEGSTEAIGKTAGKDAAAEKLTYVQLYGLDGARDRLAAVRAETEEVGDRLPMDGEVLRSLVEFVCERDC